jgi:predicted amidohydrolase
MAVVGVSNVGRLTDGPWKGRKCIGCSLAVGGDGKVLAQGPYGEAAEDLTVVTVMRSSNHEDTKTRRG